MLVTGNTVTVDVANNGEVSGTMKVAVVLACDASEPTCEFRSVNESEVNISPKFNVVK